MVVRALRKLCRRHPYKMLLASLVAVNITMLSTMSSSSCDLEQVYDGAKQAAEVSRTQAVIDAVHASPSNTRHIKYFARRSGKAPSDVPLILYWTPFFGGDYGYDEGVEYSKRHCGVGIVCEVTDDKTRFAESSGILIHPRDFRQPLPSSRKRWQHVIFYNHEPPSVVGSDLGRLESVGFNLTMTYRADSDIYMPYGYTLPTQLNSEARSVDFNFAEGKTRPVLWVVSNCRASSKRRNYVRELQKYVQVDVYGRCGTMGRCGLTGENACWKLSNKYKFYLSFESMLSKDYITEKVFERLQLGLVPIVMGAGDYKSRLPPNSYIDVRDYASPKHLADYIKLLDANDSLYSQYFKWRKSHMVAMSRAPAFCRLCMKLLDNTDPWQTYTSIRDWVQNGTTYTPEKFYPHLARYFRDKSFLSSLISFP